MPQSMDAAPSFMRGVSDRTALGDEQLSFLSRLQVDIIAGRDGQGQNPLVDAVKVDLNGWQLLLFFLFVLLRCAGGLVLLFRSRLVVGLLCLVGGLALILRFFVVALRRNRRGEGL